MSTIHGLLWSNISFSFISIFLDNIFPLVRVFLAKRLNVNLLTDEYLSFYLFLIFKLMTPGHLQVPILIGIGVQTPEFSLDCPRTSWKHWSQHACLLFKRLGVTSALSSAHKLQVGQPYRAFVSTTISTTLCMGPGKPEARFRCAISTTFA